MGGPAWREVKPPSLRHTMGSWLEALRTDSCIGGGVGSDPSPKQLPVTG